MKRALGVQAIVEWAFRLEKAQLKLPKWRDVDEEGFGFGMECVLIQRARLGCKVDGGGHKSQSYTHEDTEIEAATLAGMPDSLVGKRMATVLSKPYINRLLSISDCRFNNPENPALRLP